MALRFNPPPNWPTPPEGFVPPAGWQPDPAWGPAPQGWQLWVEEEPDSQPSPGTPNTNMAAPTAPIQPPIATAGSAPSVPSAPSYAGDASSFSTAAPTTSSAPAAPAGPAVGGWQPIDVGAAGGGKDPLTRKWWFWVIIVVVVLALLGGAVGAIFALTKGSDSDGDNTSQVQVSTQEAEKDSQEGSDSESKDEGKATASDSAKAAGSSMNDPLDPSKPFTLKAGQFDDDPNASIDVSLGAVEWNANDSLKAAFEAEHYASGYQDPGKDMVYMRVPVTVTYHGSGQLNSFDLAMDYVKDGNTHTTETLILDDEFLVQDMPRDGGSVTGYYTYKINAADKDSGVFAVSAFSSKYDGSGEVYVTAK